MTTLCTSTNAITSTVTPSTTSTITDTTTVTSTAATSTMTATTVSTEVLTETSVVTTVSTTTTTTTTSTDSTSVVPTASGFVPVASSVPGASFDLDGPVKRGVEADENEKRGFSLSKGNFNITQFTRGGRGDVSCIEYHSRCSTTTSTVTKTAPTTTFSTTVTSTSTITTTPGATTTVTDIVTSVTTTIITTTSITTTSTVATSFTSTVTSYAACATNNQANFVNGNAVSGFGGNGDPLSVDADSETECCVAAINQPNVALWAWIFESESCLVSVATTCPLPAGNQIETTSDPTANPQYGVGNANCGTWDSVVVQ
ncbi:hypothetical protein AYO21_04967 [Fonsecaea monophora]|uniref:Apple domain-containing protein n=1 Tax=Fonsecaea monophora TaxID=254056 RepID=A0A177FB77_9EURO|nr:hypothetical protein AYO21_04967 [Fonsecaea monophora]OAG40890.1 hypothetical protein AYO21_04967 [Fonsecaea monophora]